MRFDSGHTGLQSVLGELEAEVMERVWEGGAVTVRDVHARLGADRGLAYTTVMTVMSRLAQKGLLRRDRDGAAYLYRPTRSREAFDRRAARSVLSSLMKGFGAPAVSEFVRIARRDPALLSELGRQIAEAEDD